MRQILSIGGEIDALTPAEFAENVAPLVAALKKDLPPATIRESIAVTVDGSGLVGGGVGGSGFEVFDCPIGYRADLLRCIIDTPDGTAYTPQNPLTTGYLLFRRNDGNGPTELFSPASSNTVLPMIYEGGDASPKLINGEKLVVVGSGLPTGLQIRIACLWRMWSNVERSQFQTAN